MKRTLLFIVVLSSLIFTAAADAKIKMPAVFSNNMVLQRNSSVTFWGWAEPQEVIIIQVGWGETASAVADGNSQWSAQIKTTQAGGPYNVVIKGNDSNCSFTNV